MNKETRVYTLVKEVAERKLESKLDKEVEYIREVLQQLEAWSNENTPATVSLDNYQGNMQLLYDVVCEAFRTKTWLEIEKRKTKLKVGLPSCGRLRFHSASERAACDAIEKQLDKLFSDERERQETLN